jgi:hypothetical protein
MARTRFSIRSFDGFESDGRCVVADIAGCRQQDAGASEDVGERMDLDGLATGRRIDGLRFRPPAAIGRAVGPHIGAF